MPGATEYLDLSTEEGRLLFSLFATRVAETTIAAHRKYNLWPETRDEPPLRYARRRWATHQRQLFQMLGERARDGYAIWDDAFDCAWEAARQDDEGVTE